jgi:hypothetical protein
MSLDGDTLGDLIKQAIDATTVAERRALFRAMGNAIVQHIFDAGIAAAGSSSDMGEWMSQVGSFAGAAPSFSSQAIARQLLPPTYSLVTATCKGTSGTPLPAGRLAQVNRSDERFSSVAPAIIGLDGSVDVVFKAQSSGAVIAHAGDLNIIVTAVDGWESVENSSDAVPGVDSVSLNGNTLGDAIRTNIDAVPDKRDRTAVFRAVGDAIVDHIGQNGIAADPLMVAWQAQVETAINSLAPSSVAPLSATFNAVAIVK